MADLLYCICGACILDLRGRISDNAPVAFEYDKRKILPSPQGLQYYFFSYRAMVIALTPYRIECMMVSRHLFVKHDQIIDICLCCRTERENFH